MNRGFTLIELVVVMCMVTVLILVIAATLWGSVKIERADAAVLHRVTVQAQLADQFREDVSRSVACADFLGDAMATPQCLILRIADDHHIVYQWSKERLVRRELTATSEAARNISVGGDGITVEFIRPVAADDLITLRLIESRGVGTVRRTWPLDVTAALGGDLR